MRDSVEARVETMSHTRGRVVSHGEDESAGAASSSRTRAKSYTIGESERLNSYFVDLRESAPDVFEDLSATDWSRLRWKDVGRPYRVERWARGRREWEEQHGAPKRHGGDEDAGAADAQRSQEDFHDGGGAIERRSPGTEPGRPNWSVTRTGEARQRGRGRCG